MAAKIHERLSVSITGEAAEFVTSYRDEYGDGHLSSLDVVKRGLRLLMLVESLEPHQRLAIEDTQAEMSTPVAIPWKVTTNVVTIPEL